MKWNKTIWTVSSVPIVSLMKRSDVVKNVVPYALIKFGSAYYKKPTSEQAFPVYVENIIVRDVQLLALPKQPDIFQLRAEDSKEITSAHAPSRGLVFPSQAVVAMPRMLASTVTAGRVAD
jgi:hypothetical protein